MQEELNAILTISVYDVARNETARQHRQELVSNATGLLIDVTHIGNTCMCTFIRQDFGIVLSFLSIDL